MHTNNSIMGLPMPSLAHLLLSLHLLLSSYTSAECECGYSVTLDSDSSETYIFTDLLESDFFHVDITKTSSDDEYAPFGWALQAFNTTKSNARGTYGEMFSVENVIANTMKDMSTFSGTGTEGRDAGLRLSVSSEIVDDKVVSSEIATPHATYRYGTFRAGMKLTDVPGTCSAFFWYFNDTQEIDMEFLSSEFHKENSSYPVNLVLQSKQSEENGNDASGTNTFQTHYLPFDPTSGFHEYRFDFLEDKVLFYADGEVLTVMDGTAVPTSAGNIMLSHWSNGNPGWSAGPPTADATTTVSYVKAYFNSSLQNRQNDFTERCQDPSAQGAVCAVPNDSPTYFFTYEHNMTPNQTTYDQDGPNVGGHTRPVWALQMVVVLILTAWVTGL